MTEESEGLDIGLHEGVDEAEYHADLAVSQSAGLEGLERKMPEELKPGLYRDIPGDTYFQLPGVSQSKLSHMAQWTPRHLKYREDNPDDPEESDALALGSAIHDAVLLPEVFADQYMTAGPCEGVTGKGKQCSNSGKGRFGGHWFCGTHAPKDQEFDGGVVLSAKEHEKCVGARDSVRSDPDAMALLDCERHELTAVWRDAETGLLCRGRFDCLSDDGTIVSDLKKTRCAKRSSFERSLFSYYYHLQAAMYVGGARTLGLPAEVFWFIAVEDFPPYCLCLFEVHGEALEAGEKELRTLMRQYAECVEKNHWPSYESPQHITLPGYAWAQIEERVDES